MGQEGSFLRETGFPVALCTRAFPQMVPTPIPPEKPAWAPCLSWEPSPPSVRGDRRREGLQGRRKRAPRPEKPGKKAPCLQRSHTPSLPAAPAQPRASLPGEAEGPRLPSRWHQGRRGLLAGLHTAQPLRSASLFPSAPSPEGGSCKFVLNDNVCLRPPSFPD